MTNDEQQISDLIKKWQDATKVGDIETILSLMTDDVVFMVAGQEPFGKEVFERSAEAIKSEGTDARYESESSIEEMQILGDHAYARTRLHVTAIPLDDSSPSHRSGYTLTIFRKDTDGKWRLARDANLLTEKK